MTPPATATIGALTAEAAQRALPAEQLCLAQGWAFAGSIPRDARSAGGVLDANAIYSKLLDPR